MSDWKMPAVELGEVILWYPDGSPADHAMPAIVTRVGMSSVDLAIISGESCSLTHLQEVRHLRDPGRTESTAPGVWGWGPHRLQLEVLRAEIAELRKKTI